MTSTPSDEPHDPGLGSRFWTLWAAFTATNLADGFSLVAFPLLAIQLTDDARLVALITVFRFLPFLLLGLPAGLLLDRSDRRNVAIVAQIGRAGVVGFLAVATLAFGASITLLAAAAFVVGVGEVLTDGGLPGMMRAVVRRDQLEVANSRFSATQTVANHFVGPPLGAVLFTIETSSPFVVSSALFLVAAVMLGRVPGQFRATPTEPVVDQDDEPGDEPEDEVVEEVGSGASPGPLRQFADQLLMGLRYVWGHPVLRPLALAVMAFSFVGQATTAVYVILATERFGLGGVGFGVLISIKGVASVAMSFAVARLVLKAGHSNSMRFSIVSFTTAALLLGIGTAVAVAVVAVIIQGLADPAWNIVSNTIRQRLVPDEVFSRMMTAYLFLAWSMNPVGALVGGVITEQWGPEWVFLMAATVVGSLLFFARRLFRAVDEAMASPA